MQCSPFAIDWLSNYDISLQSEEFLSMKRRDEALTVYFADAFIFMVAHDAFGTVITPGAIVQLALLLVTFISPAAICLGCRNYIFAGIERGCHNAASPPPLRYSLPYAKSAFTAAMLCLSLRLRWAHCRTACPVIDGRIDVEDTSFNIVSVRISRWIRLEEITRCRFRAAINDIDATMIGKWWWPCLLRVPLQYTPIADYTLLAHARWWPRIFASPLCAHCRHLPHWCFSLLFSSRW